MFPLLHFIFSFIFSLIFFPFIKFNIIWIFLGAFLIDFDHYLLYVISCKDWSLKNAYKTFVYKVRPSKPKNLLCIFHTVEFFILMIILGLVLNQLNIYADFIFYTLIGMSFHILFDIYDFATRKCFNCRAIFLFKWIKKPNFIQEFIKD